MTNTDNLFPSVGMLLQKAVTAIDSFQPGSVLWQHFDHGRISLRGPWRLTSRELWIATAEPYNATGSGLNKEIEGEGASASEALIELLLAIKETEAQNFIPVEINKK